MGRFKRTHVTPQTALGREDMPRSLRLKLWNIVREVIDNQYAEEFIRGGGFSTRFMNDFCMEVLEAVPGAWQGLHSADNFLALWFTDDASWDSVYDVIDFIVSRDTGRGNLLPNAFGAHTVANKFNAVLEDEMSPWSFINDELIYAEDLSAVQAVAEASAAAPDLVTTHLHAALDAVMSRPKPEVRIAIDEAVKAYESMTKHVLASQQGTYGSLKQALVKRGVHEDYVEGFHYLYKFASDAQGIRHGFKPGEDPDDLSIAEARLYVVVCAEYVRYLREFFKNP